jgi:threonine/homoserine/homoserine lactone efflux protein
VPDTTTLGAFALASLALLVIPGPAVLYVLNRSVSDGRRIGLAAVAGLQVGSMVHVVAAAVGLSAVIAASAVAFNTVKWLGVAYLIWIGVRTMSLPAVMVGGDLVRSSRRRAFTQGVVVNALNVKIALFFLSFLPQFLHPDRGWIAVQALVLGLVFVGIALCTDGLYALAASGLRDVLLRGRSLAFVQRWVAGGIYIGLGLLAATTHPARSGTS